jgi:hypothetical protein
MFKFQNVGSVDRIIRLIAGAAIIIAGIVFQNWLGALGIIPILTSVVGICPAYLPFRINTTGKKS